MSTSLIAFSTWLHTLATVVFIGYYFFTDLIYLPTLEASMPAKGLRDLLEQVSIRLRPYFGGSLLVFLITGTYLMVMNQNYLGLGNFFGNPWSVLIVIKHVLVLAFLVVAVFSERAFLGQISDEKRQALKQFRWALHANLILGVVIVLLTSIAQAG
jgi:uncharacterized membrane protein